MIELILFTVVLAAPMAWMIVRKRWQLVLFAIMFLMVYEGVLRKWLLPGLQMQIYVLKDVLLLVGFAAFLMARKQGKHHERQLGTLKVLLLLNLIYAFFQLANPYSPSVIVSLLGVKNYLLYALMLFMVPYAFNTHADVENKLKTFMLFMIPVSALGLVQYSLPADHILNTYVGGDEQNIARFGVENRARSAGTFSYIGGYATFIGAMVNFALAFVIVSKGGIKKNIIPFTLLAISIMAMFTTGSRTVVWGEFVLVPIILLLCTRAGLMSGALVSRMIAGVFFIAIIFAFVGGDAVDSFNQRANNADSAMMRVLSPINEAIGALDVSPIFGMGIGATHGATLTIMNAQNYWWLNGDLFEMETARVIQEVGLFGFILVYSLRVYLLFTAISMVTRLRTPLFKALSAAIAGYFILHLFMFVINNPTAGLFYWFSAGLLFAMYRLDYAPQYAARPFLRGRHSETPQDRMPGHIHLSHAHLHKNDR